MKLMGILALLTVVIFLCLIGVQIVEWLHYQAEPSLWPAAM